MSNTKKVKYSEHLTQTIKFISPSDVDANPKVLRILVIDLYNTNSSSNEEGCIGHCRRVKKYINEIIFKPFPSEENSTVDGNGKEKTSNSNVRGSKRKRTGTEKAESKDDSKCKKFCGMYQQCGSRWVAEIRDPVKHARVWLGTYNTAKEATMAYDLAAIQFCGPKAITNFTPLPPIEDELPSTGSSTP